jgi:membrane-bound lytic murein transglycosylase B
MKRFIVCFLLIGCSTVQAESFDQWKTDFQRRAVQGGAPSSSVYRAMTSVKLLDRVIELDQKQPEGTQTLVQYVENTVTDKRVARGRELMGEYRSLLQKTESQSGIRKEILLALWGKETDFGGYTGNFSTIDSLATLAYEGRRRDFFEQELLSAIQLLDKLNWTPDQMKGSWAGAVGQCQFMPSNYIRYAVDGNGDGKVDLWHTMEDVFPSMANLLKTEGWHRNEGWGQKVKLPPGFDKNLVGRDKTARPYSFWEQHGVKFSKPVSASEGDAIRLYQPDEGAGAPAYAIYKNFDVLMRWNRSGYFATAVGRLSDRIGE